MLKVRNVFTRSLCFICGQCEENCEANLFRTTMKRSGKQKRESSWSPWVKGKKKPGSKPSKCNGCRSSGEYLFPRIRDCFVTSDIRGLYIFIGRRHGPHSHPRWQGEKIIKVSSARKLGVYFSTNNKVCRFVGFLRNFPKWSADISAQKCVSGFKNIRDILPVQTN